MSFFAPRKAGRNRLNRAGYLTASFVSSLDNTATRLSSPPPQTRSLKTSHLAHALSFSELFLACVYLFLSIYNANIADFRFRALKPDLTHSVLFSLRFPLFMCAIKPQNIILPPALDPIRFSDQIRSIQIYRALPLAVGREVRSLLIIDRARFFAENKHTRAGTCHFTEHNV